MTLPYTLHPGDCLATLRGMPDCSVDSIVTDPPYGLSFMGKKWDYDVPGVDVWAECLRVLKPGGHLLAFAGTRTQHRMAVRIEDAGFEIRDMIAWVYGSGFPKSHNGEWGGTALKPALEPITMARKPIIGTVAANWEDHSTGALNIDGCRVALNGDYKCKANGRPSQTGLGDNYDPDAANQPDTVGRWPANLIHDGSDEVLAGFPAKAGASAPVKGTEASIASLGNVTGERARVPGAFHADTGSAARFFYCAKASKSDRDAGLEHIEATDRVNGNKWTDQDYRVANGERSAGRESGPRKNIHPTVKPTDLMAYLVRLVTPPGGVVLDPFMGSGSTGKAAMREGMRFIGCEMSPEYMAIADARITHELALVQAAAVPVPVPQFDLFAQ